MKKCTKCKKIKPSDVDNFHKDSSKKDGLYSSCRKCVLEYRIINKDNLEKGNNNE